MRCVYAFPPLLADWVDSFSTSTFLGGSPHQWGWLAFGFGKGLLLAWFATWITRMVLRRLKTRVPGVVWPTSFEDGLTTPIALLIVATSVRAWVEVLAFAEPSASVLRKVCEIVLVVAASMLVIRLLTVGKEYVRVGLTRGMLDQDRIRSITTRVNVPVRMVQFLVALAGVAMVCLQFQAVQQVGVSILASAGLAGIVLGLAAQRTVSNLFAGLQLAFAQPLKIGDEVVVEGEFGEVEEIGLTQVVLKLWDLRRLILPVSYFVEHPFQNWTKGTPEVLGTVFLYTDFTIPVAEVRNEFEHILGETDLWDGKMQKVEVTKLTANTVEVRALMSSQDSGHLWALQCLVREKLLTWLQARKQKSSPGQLIATNPTPVSNGMLNNAS